MTRILVVEDDAQLNKLVCVQLNDHGYEAVGCLNAQEAYDAIYEKPVSLMISDIMMPEIDGFEFAKSIRELNKQVPILFMTARDDFDAKEKGFELGVDDYMVKPINMKELLLRIKALLRRANIAADHKLTIGAFVMDADDMSAALNGEEIVLTTREFNILFKMLSYPKHTFSRMQLMEEFWNVDSDATLRAVDVHIARLRDKLAACGDFKIVTVGDWATRRCWHETDERAKERKERQHHRAVFVADVPAHRGVVGRADAAAGHGSGRRCDDPEDGTPVHHLVCSLLVSHCPDLQPDHRMAEVPVL